MNYLEGKKILFIAWKFYNYPLKIKNKIESFGATVDYFPSTPSSNIVKTKISSKLNKSYKISYYDSIFEKIKDKNYDYVFMINVAHIQKYFLEKIYDRFSNAKKILYSWDSEKSFPGVTSKYKYFDKIFTFEKEDAQNNKKLTFLPLFFDENLVNEDELENKKFQYDFSFVGLAHSERYNFINKIKKFADENGYSYCFKLYLPSYLHYIYGKYIKKIFPKAKRRDFVYKSVTDDELKEIMNNSRIIIDLEQSSQVGLTMRTIETHGIKRKLITTNKSIEKYDFYDKNNILIVDRNNPIIPNNFIKKDYKILDSQLYEEYSLGSWVKKIFEETDYEN